MLDKECKQHNKLISTKIQNIKQPNPYLVFHSSSDFDRLFRAALCFSSSLFFSSLAKSDITKNSSFFYKQATTHKRAQTLTDVSVLHGSYVGSQSAVGFRNHVFYLFVQLVELHRECCEVVHLEREQTHNGDDETLILNICFFAF